MSQRSHTSSRLKGFRRYHLATLSMVLAGCTPGLVSSGLDHQSWEVPIPVQPCPVKPATAVLLARRAAMAGTAAENNEARALVMSGGSDLDVGKRVIGAAINRAVEGGAPRTRRILVRGLDVAAFVDDFQSTSEEAAGAGDEALDIYSALSPGETPPALFAGGAPGPLRPRTIPSSELALSVVKVAKATTENGWEASFIRSLGHLERVRAGLAPAMTAEDANDAADEAFHRFLIAQYFKAYFRNGAIFSVTLSTEKLKAAVKKVIESSLANPASKPDVDQAIDKLDDTVFSQLCGTNTNCLALGAIGDTNFVTRSGQSYAFSGITASIDPTAAKKVSFTGAKITSADVSDVVRVFVEATGDYWFAVPGVPKSTACQAGYLCTPVSPSPYSPDQQAKDVAAVNETADKVETGTSSIVGIAIRGGWFFSLNNEDLAAAIQTALAVSARKIAEKAAWDRKEPPSTCPAPSRDLEFKPVPLLVR